MGLVNVHKILHIVRHFTDHHLFHGKGDRGLAGGLAIKGFGPSTRDLRGSWRSWFTPVSNRSSNRPITSARYCSSHPLATTAPHLQHQLSFSSGRMYRKNDYVNDRVGSQTDPSRLHCQKCAAQSLIGSQPPCLADPHPGI